MRRDVFTAKKTVCEATKICRSLAALQTIVTWIGSQANIFEKQKVREIASLIRDTDRHGKARIVDFNEGEEPEEMLKVSTESNLYSYQK